MGILLLGFLFTKHHIACLSHGFSTGNNANAPHRFLRLYLRPSWYCRPIGMVHQYLALILAVSVLIKQCLAQTLFDRIHSLSSIAIRPPLISWCGHRTHVLTHTMALVSAMGRFDLSSLETMSLQQLFGNLEGAHLEQAMWDACADQYESEGPLPWFIDGNENTPSVVLIDSNNRINRNQISRLKISMLYRGFDWRKIGCPDLMWSRPRSLPLGMITFAHRFTAALELMRDPSTSSLPLIVKMREQGILRSRMWHSVKTILQIQYFLRAYDNSLTPALEESIFEWVADFGQYKVAFAAFKRDHKGIDAGGKNKQIFLRDVQLIFYSTLNISRLWHPRKIDHS